MAAIDPGSTAAFQAPDFTAGATVVYVGTLTMVYTIPDNEGGNYFEPGIDLAYDGDGYYGTFFPDAGNPVAPGSITYLGTVDGLASFQATVPYQVNAGTLNGFGLGIAYNSNYSPQQPFYVDDIEVGPIPEPTSLSLTALGVLTLWAIYKRKRA
jgi:hypothetical protein